MIFYLILCNVVFIPQIYSSNTTVSNTDIANQTISQTHKVNLSKEGKVSLLSEGGSLLPETSVLSLSKEKLSNLDYELGKTKAGPVVPRKGVVYKEEDTVKPQQKDSPTIHNNIVSAKLSENTDILLKHLTNSTNKLVNSKANSDIFNKTSSNVQSVNKTEIPKKPEVLSYDKVVNSTVKSLPETLITSQIKSSNKALKAYVKTANSHPGMIMPLVISILLVPMFAVLGYMALRRGQEAWKNRHYKRMDFLLDGMYND